MITSASRACRWSDDALYTDDDPAWVLAILVTFAATCVATLYHYALGWPAPYAWSSLPKLLGTAGGVMLTLGTAGLWRLHHQRHPLQRDTLQRTVDRGFIALLFATAASGLLLALARHTPALALLLSVHLACVMALLVTPASTRARRFCVSISSTLVMRDRQRTIESSSGSAPPQSEVPAPRGTTLTWLSWQ